MSSKQDRQGARTPADLERKYQFDKSFAEIMGVALDAQKSVAEAEAIVKAELSLKLGYDDNDAIVSMINASADIIELVGNRISIASDYFTLDVDGRIACENADIAGKLTSTEGYLGNVAITTDGLSCGGVDLGTWGIRAIGTNEEGYTSGVFLYPGVMAFSAQDAPGVTRVTLAAPRSTDTNVFLRVVTDKGHFCNLYFDPETSTVKYSQMSTLSL